MYVYAPVQYQLLLKVIGAKRRWKNDRDRLIFSVEKLAEGSGNPIFTTQAFHRAVIDYRIYGNTPPSKARWTLKDVLYFARNSYTIHKEMERCVE